MPNSFFRAPDGIALEGEHNLDRLRGRPDVPSAGDVIANRKAERRAEAVMKDGDSGDPL